VKIADTTSRNGQCFIGSTLGNWDHRSRKSKVSGRENTAILAMQHIGEYRKLWLAIASASYFSTTAKGFTKSIIRTPDILELF